MSDLLLENADLLAQLADGLFLLEHQRCGCDSESENSKGKFGFHKSDCICNYGRRAGMCPKLWSASRCVDGYSSRE
jgi:hypothetical protein